MKTNVTALTQKPGSVVWAADQGYNPGNLPDLKIHLAGWAPTRIITLGIQNWENKGGQGPPRHNKAAYA